MVVAGVRLVTLLLAFPPALLCRSYVIQPHQWIFKGHTIAYEQVQPKHDTNNNKIPSEVPILLLNGFGVGSFHQHRLIHELMQRDCTHPIFAMDYLGQGRSWPNDCNDGRSVSERGLCYSGRLWVDQITQFIHDVILPSTGCDKVHIIGNSVGGHLAVCVAAQDPSSVASLCLLNATPVWGLNLPGWSGHLPAPALPRAIGRYLFDRIRDLSTIEQYLANAYANRAAFDDELMQEIRSCTEGQGGHAAFASILWSPPVRVALATTATEGGFDDCLRALHGMDVLLLFGRDDPWCKPAFAKRMLGDLAQRPTGSVARYVELSHVGHCPHHEAPRATATILNQWLASKDRAKVDLRHGMEVQEAWGLTTVAERSEQEIPLSWVDKLAVAFV